MTDTKVREFADKLSMPHQDFLLLLKEAGVNKTLADDLTDMEKEQLLQHISGRKKITLKRRANKLQTVTNPKGNKIQVPILVQKNRTYVKKTLLEDPAESLEGTTGVANPASHTGDSATLEGTQTETGAVVETIAGGTETNGETTAHPVLDDTGISTAESTGTGETEDAVTLAAPDAELADASAALEAEFVDVEYAKGSVSEAPPKTGKAAPKSASGKPAAAEKTGGGDRSEKSKDSRNKRKVNLDDDEEGADRKGKRRTGSSAGRSSDLRLAGDGRRSKRRLGGKDQGGAKHAFELPVAPMVREIPIPAHITVGELAQRMAIKASEVIKQLMKLGMMMHINQSMDQDTAVLVVEELGHKPKLIDENAVETDLLADLDSQLEDTPPQPRAPVVTIMGHVDHGKTSLLDYIRRTKIAASESGGITQHIGAYRVDLPQGSVTFLDTPGHAAFTAMRARGAHCTDIVVLVVAADDGVMPQTVEAIQHAKAAQVPLIVAITKIDKDTADLDKIKSALSQHGITSEEWGGDTQFVPLSAKTGEGVDALLDSILVQAEILELRAVESGPARGVVIESRLDKGRGPVATILVQSGTLQKGDIALVGTCYGRVRAMTDVTTQSLSAAGPSTPVEILGLSGIPQAGDTLVVVRDERKAREVATWRQAKLREKQMSQSQSLKLEAMMDQMAAGVSHTLHVVLKGDVQGSVEAISAALQQLANQEVTVRLIVAGVGGISESDVNLAVASRALILGFNVRADAAARRIADAEGLSIRYYSIIYDLIDDVKQAVVGLLKPEVRENIVGVAQVREVFRSSKFGAIAGCMVQEGIMKRHLPIRVLRNHVVIYEGELESLRRFKDDVQEVRHGMECGIGVKDYNDVKPGDQIEAFEKITIERVFTS